jgi:hypothetical protein
MVKNLVAPIVLLAVICIGYVWLRESRFTDELNQADRTEQTAPSAGGARNIFPAPSTDSTEETATRKPDSKTALSPRVAALAGILASKNDNDPRLDTDYVDLTPEEKRQIQDQYKNLKPENLNERGTLVFVLGQNLKDPDDMKFLEQVLSEPTCLSLNDCKAPRPRGNDDHLEIGVDLTLSYPQVVSLKVMEAYVSEEENKDPRILSEIQRVVQQAKQSENMIVSRLAYELEEEMEP